MNWLLNNKMDQEKEITQTTPEIQDEILLAALKLFVEKGYFNTSLVDITEAAGIKNTATLYHYFKNKQMIAVKLYDNIVDNLNISVDEIRRRNQKPSEQLRGIVDLLFKLTEDAPYIMKFLLVLNIHEFLPEAKQLYQTAAFIKITKIIQAGINAGEIRSIDSVLISAYFFGIINNTLAMNLSGVLDKKTDTYLSQTWLAAWNVIAKK